MLGTSVLDYVVGEVDEQLGEATLGGSIVAKGCGEGGIAEGLGKALTESLTGTGIVAQTVSN